MPNRRIKVRIRADQYQWLEKHPMINFSGLVIQIINEQKCEDIPFILQDRKRTTQNDSRYRSVSQDAYIPDPDKEWLDKIRLRHKSRSFLSIYVQRRLDYLIKTKSISKSDIVPPVEMMMGQ